MFICDFQVWLRKEDGSKTKLYIRQLQKGKYRIRKSWNPTYQGQHFDLGYIESVEFQSILRQIVSACSNTCYMCNVFDAYNTRLWFHDMLLWQQWFLRMAIFKIDHTVARHLACQLAHAQKQRKADQCILTPRTREHKT